MNNSVILSFLMIISITVISCLNTTESVLSDQIIRIENKSGLPIEKVDVVQKMNGSLISEESIDSNSLIEMANEGDRGSLIEFRLKRTEEQGANFEIVYQCYSYGVVIISRTTNFDENNIQTSLVLDQHPLVMEALQEYNDRHAHYQGTPEDLFDSLFIAKMIRADNTDPQGFYDAYKMRSQSDTTKFISSVWSTLDSDVSTGVRSTEQTASLLTVLPQVQTLVAEVSSSSSLHNGLASDIPIAVSGGTTEQISSAGGASSPATNVKVLDYASTVPLSSSAVLLSSQTLIMLSSGAVVPGNTIEKLEPTGIVTDTRNNLVYNWVRINGALWMTDNLNYNSGIEGESFCHTPTASGECDSKGRVYSWVSAMGLPLNYATSPWLGDTVHQGLCFAGWHIPTALEWEGIKEYDSQVIGSNDQTVEKSTNFWTATTSVDNDTLAQSIRLQNPGVSFSVGFENKATLGYIRCVKNP